jgi:hypothetical protein
MEIRTSFRKGLCMVIGIVKDYHFNAEIVILGYIGDLKKILITPKAERTTLKAYTDLFTPKVERTTLKASYTDLFWMILARFEKTMVCLQSSVLQAVCFPP